MISILRWIGKSLPTLILSFALGVTVWISAVSESDPMKEQVYPQPVSIEVIGQDPALLLTNAIPQQASITLSAPTTIWNQLTNEQIPVRAVIDLSGLAAGVHEVPVQIQVGIRPVQIVSYSPRTVTVHLEPLSNRSFTIHLVERGDVAVGFQAGSPQLSERIATVSGPDSLVNKVQEVRAIVDVTEAQQSIDRDLSLVAVDSEENVLNGLTISPDRTHVSIPITQRGGYRNVVVKVTVNGRVASGFRVTNISVFPPTVTVFSSDPKLVEQLPGYVETAVLDLTGAKDDRDVFLPLNLPPGVSVVGDSDVEVQVGIAAIEGSITLEGMKVEVQGVAEGLKADVSPGTVDIILSGPLPELDQITPQDIRIVVDMSGETVGSFQRVPKVVVQNQDLKVESILPGSIEISLSQATNLTPGTKTPEPVRTATRPSPTNLLDPDPTPKK